MPNEILKLCKKHGETIFIFEKRGYYRCKKCRSNQVSERRKKTKLILVKKFGGKCQICGYKKYQGALHFHHLNKKNKSFELSCKGLTKKIDKLIEEAKKCILLCANCHSEVEANITKI